MPLNTIIPIAFALIYLSYIVLAARSARKKGGSYEYRPLWILASLLILGLCIYAIATGRSITDFIG